MRSKGSARELERKRFDALRLLELGYGPTEVGRILQAHRRTVHRWREEARRGGPEALKAKHHPGPTPKLTVSEKARLARILLEGAPASGYATQLWTGRRVVEVIRRTFGVSYHPHHVPRILHELGWSCQKPQRKARERDEQAIGRWLKRDWARIKKGVS